MPSFSRIFVIVLDSVGVGELPDAHAFGDAGSDTLGNVARYAAENGAGLAMPNLMKLGLGNAYLLANCGAAPPPGIVPAENTSGFFGVMTEKSAGKDTTSGHWEMMGVIRSEPSRTFPGGFPPEFVRNLSEACGAEFLLNKPYSGTEAIYEFGEESIRTGKPILYTSADSVLQIAAHTDFTPLETLYKWCEAARLLAQGDYLVDRVIARPFAGGVVSREPLALDPAGFTRTGDRKDYSISPPETHLDLLTGFGVRVTAVGKIKEIFAGRGVSESHKTAGNENGMEVTARLARDGGGGFYFVNLVDFDSKYGHRNDPTGYAAALSEFDGWLGGFLPLLGGGDLLIITADHGNDPTTPSTDHSREYVPLLCLPPRHGAAGAASRSLGVRGTFADVGATLLENWGIVNTLAGTSFLRELMSGDV